MLKQDIHDNWTVRAVGDLSDVPSELRREIVPARVPGCVHTDLIRAGKIPDPYLDLNEHKLQWIGLTDWQYRCEFVADAQLFDHERIDLVFDGLDTVAKIEMNGTLVGQTQNMHRSYRFDVRNVLKRAGANELVITFSSAVKYAEAMQSKLGSRPWVNGPAGPFNFIRKMACNFGWDWGPALVTCGLWKAVRLEAWSVVRIGAIRSRIRRLDKKSASVVFRADYEGNPSRITCQVLMNSMACSFKDPGEIATGCEIQILDPKLWWPSGHGIPETYYAWIGLHFGKHSFVSSYVPFGFRTVELDTSPDDVGRQFVLKVNGKPIFCKGFNWIPDDCFLDRANDPARLRKRIQQAVDCGANMLRVWGGGIYETDEFYNICDELGVLVWQDFPFACAMYPEEEPFWSEVEAEARENAARLSSHPSLMIWNGCNENIWGYRDWGWKDHADVKSKTWGKNYYLDLLPRVMQEVDPSRPYWPASPWSGDADCDNGIPPNDPNHGNTHCWAPWFREDHPSFRKFSPRFCSEFGFQGLATYSSIARVVILEDRDFGSLAMRHRQKSGNPASDDGDKRNLRSLVRHFNIPGAQELLDALEVPDPKPTAPPCGSAPLLPARHLPSSVNFDDLHYLLQVNQARALQTAVEWFRSRQPRCMGTLIWQLNDCWPGATSWSAIDGDGKPKPMWYAARRFFAPRLLTIQPESDGSLWLHVVNDTDEPCESPLMVFRSSLDGRGLAEQKIRMNVGPRAVEHYQLDARIATPDDPSEEFIAVGADPVWFFANDKERKYPSADFRAELNNSKLTIHAKSLLRDLCIFVDRLDPDATISDQLVTLLPNESFTFDINSKIPLTLEQLTSPPVFRCVNEFGAP